MSAKKAAKKSAPTPTAPDDAGPMPADGGYEVVADGNHESASEAATPVATSCLIDKNADGLWRVTSTFSDGRVTVTEWADLRHAVHNTAAWVAANL